MGATTDTCYVFVHLARDLDIEPLLLTYEYASTRLSTTLLPFIIAIKCRKSDIICISPHHYSHCCQGNNVRTSKLAWFAASLSVVVYSLLHIQFYCIALLYIHNCRIHRKASHSLTSIKSPRSHLSYSITPSCVPVFPKQISLSRHHLHQLPPMATR